MDRLSMARADDGLGCGWAVRGWAGLRMGWAELKMDRLKMGLAEDGLS